ncbi:MAG: membrane protease YdiL (CAAX protease family) [Planctomycetota bacterium]|jgi:membrane protease YdiL (CAAX protease family)
MNPSKPSLWFTLLVGVFLVPILSWCSHLLYDALWWFDDADQFFVDLFGLPDGEYASTSFFLIALLSHGLDLSSIFLLARFSGESLIQSLALKPGRLSVFMMPALLAGTFMAAILAVVVNEQLFEDYGDLAEQMNESMGVAGQSNLVLLLLVAAVLPALGEELFIRGYLQRRLLRRLPAWSAILLSSVLFAAAHGNVEHALSVFPIGLWFGIVAYYSESVWPGVFCHFFFNASLALLHSISSSPGSMEAEGGPSGPGEVGPLGAFVAGSILLCLLTLLTWFVKSRRRSDVPGGNPLPV